jgi:hypothetical protein
MQPTMRRQHATLMGSPHPDAGRTFIRAFLLPLQSPSMPAKLTAHDGRADELVEMQEDVVQQAMPKVWSIHHVCIQMKGHMLGPSSIHHSEMRLYGRLSRVSRIGCWILQANLGRCCCCCCQWPSYYLHSSDVPTHLQIGAHHLIHVRSTLAAHSRRLTPSFPHRRRSLLMLCCLLICTCCFGLFKHTWAVLLLLAGPTSPNIPIDSFNNCPMHPSSRWKAHTPPCCHLKPFMASN